MDRMQLDERNLSGVEMCDWVTACSVMMRRIAEGDGRNNTAEVGDDEEGAWGGGEGRQGKV